MTSGAAGGWPRLDPPRRLHVVLPSRWLRVPSNLQPLTSALSWHCFPCALTLSEGCLSIASFFAYLNQGPPIPLPQPCLVEAPCLPRLPRPDLRPEHSNLSTRNVQTFCYLRLPDCT